MYIQYMYSIYSAVWSTMLDSDNDDDNDACVWSKCVLAMIHDSSNKVRGFRKCRRMPLVALVPALTTVHRALEWLVGHLRSSVPPTPMLLGRGERGEIAANYSFPIHVLRMYIHNWKKRNSMQSISCSWHLSIGKW